MSPERALVLWFPDWPLTAFRSDPTVADPPGEEDPFALLQGYEVLACSAAARRSGVRRGQRRRDAQALCPELRVAPHEPERDQRLFLPLVDLVDARAPGVQIIRPGLCALRLRGPARFYRGEEPAARVLIDALGAAGTPVAAGIADGVFAAERAARLTPPGEFALVPPGGNREFLASFPLSVFDDAELARLLAQLGIRTLGEFAALDAEAVRDRFGAHGARLHALSRGEDPQRVIARIVPQERAREAAFEPPLELAEQVAFAARASCDEMLAALGADDLVCTELRIVLRDEHGAQSERVWLHPSYFTAAEIVDRVRWQLEACLLAETLRGGLASARLIPETVAPSSHYSPTLLRQGSGERIHHALSRIQGMLGHESVRIPSRGGGRWLTERTVLTPWGDRVPELATESPWQGSLPAPFPATVFSPPLALRVDDAAGRPLTIDDRGSLSADPARIDGRELIAWAGPWPVYERLWDESRRREAYRFQLVDIEQTAWAVFYENGEWRAEGRYD